MLVCCVEFVQVGVLMDGLYLIGGGLDVVIVSMVVLMFEEWLQWYVVVVVVYLCYWFLFCVQFGQILQCLFKNGIWVGYVVW